MENIEARGPVPAGDYQSAVRNDQFASDCREYSKEFIMPDYVPDIRKVISASIRTELSETGRNEDRIGWECTLTFTAMLLCEDSCVHSVVLQGTVDGEIRCLAPEDSWIEVTLENAGMRATDPRKLTGRGRVCVRVCGHTPVNVGLQVEGGDAASEANIEKKSKPLEYVSVCRATARDMRASADIELDGDEKEINDIICCEIRPAITQVIPSDGRIELKGEAAVDLIYTDADGDCRSHSARVPISGTVDTACDYSGAVAFARTDEIKAVVQNNSYGEKKIVELDFSWNADVYGVVPEECEAVVDLYSTSDETLSHGTTVRLDRCVCAFTERVQAGGECSAEDLSLSRATEIAAAHPEVAVENVGYADDGSVTVGGTVTVALICRTDDKADGCVTGEMRFPFSFSRKVQTAGRGDPEFRADACVQSCRVRLSGANLSADTELSLAVIAWEPFSEEIITEVSVTGPADPSRAPVTLYYNDGGESLWDISKKYRVPADDVLAGNGMTEDELKNKRVLVIPPRRRGPAFSRII